MTRPGIEPRSPGPLANTQPTWPMSQLKIFSWNGIKYGLFFNIIFLRLHTLLPSVLGYHWSKKSSMTDMISPYQHFSPLLSIVPNPDDIIKIVISYLTLYMMCFIFCLLMEVHSFALSCNLGFFFLFCFIFVCLFVCFLLFFSRSESVPV